MANKRPTKQDAVRTSKRRVLVVGAIAVGVLAILWAGWWLVFKHNAYSPDKNAVKREVQSLLNSVSPRGREVYSDLLDKGCESNTVGTATSTGCGFAGYKYYKDNGSLAQELRALDSQILNVGWQRTLFNGQTNVEVEKVLNGQSLQLVFLRN